VVAGDRNRSLSGPERTELSAALSECLVLPRHRCMLAEMPQGDTADGTSANQLELEALSTLIRALQGLDSDSRKRVFASVATFFGLGNVGSVPTESTGQSSGIASVQPSRGGFSEDRAPTPKAFVFAKRPATDVERVATLAYYLTHYRDTPFFKTLDIGKLNTEAAQLKFANASNAVENAVKTGWLVPASKGAKQLSALGEVYVQALPDRDAARSAVAHVRSKKRVKRPGRSAQATTDEQFDQSE
jgi:hypothetical protein